MEWELGLQFANNELLLTNSAYTANGTTPGCLHNLISL